MHIFRLRNLLLISSFLFFFFVFALIYTYHGITHTDFVASPSFGGDAPLAELHSRDLLTPPPRSNAFSKGPGEHGKPFVIDKNSLSPEELHEYEMGEKQHAFNQYGGSLISRRRHLPDYREPGCRKLEYPLKMQPASVIIIFHQEDKYALHRTVHSVIDRSPPELINEIILVDDASTLPHLKAPLELYMKSLGKVKIVRASKRQGLIRARLLGIQAATSSVLVFLDSHVECTEGWLPPLLHRIAEDERNVAVPVIDVIDKETFQYQYVSASSVQIGGFEWNLLFNWYDMPDREARRPGAPISPIKTPCMAGGLFAISSKFFHHLGLYDPGLEVWGGENVELSLKVWMCGGRLEILPCSRVGHIFRDVSPYSWVVTNTTNPLVYNALRIVKTFLGKHEQHYFDRVPLDKSSLSDVSERKKLLKSLNCKSFDWFLVNISPDLFDPCTALAHGDIRNGDNVTCIEAEESNASLKKLRPYPCHNMKGNQLWSLSTDGEIRRDNYCVNHLSGEVTLMECNKKGEGQSFVYDENNLIRQNDLCVTLSQDRTSISMTKCDNSPRQTWFWTRKRALPKLKRNM